MNISQQSKLACRKVHTKQTVGNRTTEKTTYKRKANPIERTTKQKKKKKCDVYLSLPLKFTIICGPV